MATASDLRIGHAERDATVAGLREHFAEGRLTIEEFHQRLDSVFAAKTAGDLARVTADLPQARPDVTYRREGRALGAGWTAGQGSSWQRESWQGGSWRGGAAGRTRASALSAIAAVIMVALAIMAIVSFFIPFALLGFWTTRPLLILAAVLMFARRIVRRIFGGAPPRTGRRRRWPL